MSKTKTQREKPKCLRLETAEENMAYHKFTAEL